VWALDVSVSLASHDAAGGCFLCESKSHNTLVRANTVGELTLSVRVGVIEVFPLRVCLLAQIEKEKKHKRVMSQKKHAHTGMARWGEKHTLLNHIKRFMNPQSRCFEWSVSIEMQLWIGRRRNCSYLPSASGLNGQCSFALGATLARSFALRTGSRCCSKGQELVGWIGRWVHLWGLLFRSWCRFLCILFMFVVDEYIFELGLRAYLSQLVCMFAVSPATFALKAI